jgi:hypothetical protein
MDSGRLLLIAGGTLPSALCGAGLSKVKFGCGCLYDRRTRITQTARIYIC